MANAVFKPPEPLNSGGKSADPDGRLEKPCYLPHLAERRTIMLSFGKKEPEFKFQLGATVKGTITEFEGVVIQRTQWLNNCNTYGVQPRKLLEGKIQETGSFGEPQLELVAVDPVPVSRKTGGPERSVPSPCR